MSQVKKPSQWVSAGSTHPGMVRRMNQDAFLDRPDIGLWVVADGMGGHARGERASQLVVERLSNLPRPQLLGRSVREAECLVADANRRLIDEADRSGEQIIGTTVAALLAIGGSCALLWVGDSRIYRLRAERLVQLTTDHTEVQQWVTDGKLSAEDAEGHPYAGVLSRAVGAEDEVRIDTRIETLHPGDRYLLCSDGLTKELAHARIESALGVGTPAETVRDLLDEACDSGGRDNVTAVVVDILPS